MRKEKVRYARDRFRIIQSMIDQYGVSAVLEAVDFCKYSNLSGANILKDYLTRKTKNLPKPEPLAATLPVADAKYHVTTQKRPLKVLCEGGGEMMLTPRERVLSLLSDLRIQPIDFDAIYAGKNNLTPLESVELFLVEELRFRVEKQNLLRRKRAALPAEKTIDAFDFGFQRSVARAQMLRLSDMTWVEWAHHQSITG